MRSLVIALAASVSFCMLSACDDSNFDPCAVSESEDNLSLEERAERCPAQAQENFVLEPTPTETPEAAQQTPQQHYADIYQFERDTEETQTSFEEYESLERNRSKRRLEYFTAYLQIVRDLPEVRVDLERAFTRLLVEFNARKAVKDGGIESDSFALYHALVKAWDDGSVERHILSPLLVRYRDAVLAKSKETGFDPNIRYSPKRDHEKFWCSDFGGEVPVIHNLYQRTDPKSSAARRWRLQSLDYQELQSCEGSADWYAEYKWWETAYHGYKELGYGADAAKYALLIAKNRLHGYTYAEKNLNGGTRSLDTPNPYGEPDLAETKKWLAVISPDVRHALLKASAKEAEGLRNYAQAAVLYTEIGDATNAKRMNLLVVQRADAAT